MHSINRLFIDCTLLSQIRTLKCGCTLATNGWRSARHPSTSAPSNRSSMRRSPSTCRGKRSANVRSTSASWTLTTLDATSSSVASPSLVSCVYISYCASLSLIIITHRRRSVLTSIPPPPPSFCEGGRVFAGVRVWRSLWLMISFPCRALSTTRSITLLSDPSLLPLLLHLASLLMLWSLISIGTNLKIFPIAFVFYV